MPSSMRKSTLLLVSCIAAAAGFVDIGNATPFGIDAIARNHELDEGAKNHGAVVSAAAKHHGGGVSTEPLGEGLAPVNFQSTISSSASSLQIVRATEGVSLTTIPEPGIFLLLSTGLVGFLLWSLWWYRALQLR